MHDSRLSPSVPALALACLVAAPSFAGSAHLETADGLSVEVRQVRSSPGRWMETLASWAPTVSNGLAYRVSEPDGTDWTGFVPGPSTVSAVLEPTLAADPVTGEILLVVAVAGLRGADGALQFSSWTGQSFTPLEPFRTVLEDELRGHAPMLGFRSQGDAVLAWRESVAGGHSLRFRHLDLGAGGESESHAYYDLGNVWSHVPGGRLGHDGDTLRTWLIPDTHESEAWIVLDDAEGGGSAVLAIELEGIDSGTGGMGVAPVPVTFASDVTHGEGESASRDRPASPGRVIESHRIIAGEREAIYWLDDGEMFVLAVGDREAATATVPIRGPAPPVEELEPILALRHLRLATVAAEPLHERRLRRR